MKCFICGNKEKFRSLKEEFCNSNNYLCMCCGLVFIPREDDKVKKYYKDEGYFKNSPNLALKKALISKSLLIRLGKERIKDLLDIYKIDFNERKVLDVGCAYGELLYVLQNKYQAKAIGIEASTETAKTGGNMFDISIKSILLEEFNSKKKFDVIFCCHTLEHVSNPTKFLAILKELMNKESILYIEVPNILKPSGGFDLNTFLYDEHIQTFSSYNLSLFFHNLGFSILQFSDKGFLKFFLTINKRKQNNVKTKEISSEKILNFLTNYKKHYNFFSYCKVYIDKLIYFSKLLNHKVLDFIYKFVFFYK